MAVNYRVRGIEVRVQYFLQNKNTRDIKLSLSEIRLFVQAKFNRRRGEGGDSRILTNTFTISYQIH